MNNSKEALQRLFDNRDCKLDSYYFMAYEDRKIIEHDLDRLKKLEKAIEKIKSLPNCDECDSNWHKGCMCLQRKIKEVLNDE